MEATVEEKKAKSKRSSGGACSQLPSLEDMIGGEEREMRGGAVEGEGGEFGEDEEGVGVSGVAGLDGLEVEE
ncbi:hypothetical protein M0R45_008315 [Rubus argutus]|uniref:Uncharacterized protein n=1 Tax=Rubus argutus TaxID=59490 RepID=A0AAW1Y4J4_RUBAR